MQKKAFDKLLNIFMITTLGKLGIIDTSSTQYRISTNKKKRISTKTIVNIMLNALMDREYSSLCWWLHNSVFAKINRNVHLERVTFTALN